MNILSVGSRFVGGCLWLALFLLFVPAISHAQMQQASLAGNGSLPDAPGWRMSPQGQSAAQKGTAKVSGVVTDSSGAAVPEATVELSTRAGVLVAKSRSLEHGEFLLGGVGTGEFHVSVHKSGFRDYMSTPFALMDGEFHQVGPIELAVAGGDTAVEVYANSTAVAQRQIEAEEKQKVLGLLPNFYTSFVPDAAPMSSKQKYSLAWHETLDPSRFIGTAFGAAVEQASGSFKGYGNGVAGYAKRYAALYGDGLTSDLLSHAVFPSIFHQDPRYFYQGTGTTASRLRHAAGSALFARSDSGKTMPDYSDLLGDIGAGALSNLYYPHADRGVSLVFTNAGIGVGGRMLGGIMREFVLPKLTKNVPK